MIIDTVCRFCSYCCPIEAEVEGERLTDDEIISFVGLLMIAGNDTTATAIGSAKPIAAPPRLIAAAALPSRISVSSLYGVILT